jgi:hypothetical protein
VKELVDRERSQLIGHWTALSKKRPCWVEQPFNQLLDLAGEARPLRQREARVGGQPSERSRLMLSLRKWHDQLGWRAANDRLGRCVGAIYRTEGFVQIEPSDRDGSKTAGRNIHIEHTVPVKALFDRWGVEVGAASPSRARTAAWFLFHSVVTAVRLDEERHIPRALRDTTNCFDEPTRHSAKPFARYANMRANGVVVWNILDGQAVDIEQFTLADHYDVVLRLIEEAGGSPPFVEQLRERAPA